MFWDSLRDEACEVAGAWNGEEYELHLVCGRREEHRDYSPVHLIFT